MDTDLGPRVRQLIDTLQMSHGDIARSIGSTPDKLSKSLAGQRRFTVTELAYLAELASTTVDWILTGVEPPSPSVAARAPVMDRPIADEIAAVAHRFTDADEQLDGPERRTDLPDLPPRPTGWSYLQQAQSLADWAWTQCDSSDVDPLIGNELAHTLERVFGVDVAIVPLPDALDGGSWATPTTRLILANTTVYWARQRFTIAHELGHILAGDAQILIAEQVHDIGSPTVMEKRANAFAAAFLMPAKRLRTTSTSFDQNSFMALAVELRVSPLTLGWRLKNLGLITEQQRKGWARLTAEGCALSLGEVDLVAEASKESSSTRLPPRLLLGHLRSYSQGRSSATPLAKLLDRPVADIIEQLTPMLAPLS